MQELVCTEQPFPLFLLIRLFVGCLLHQVGDFSLSLRPLSYGVLLFADDFMHRRQPLLPASFFNINDLLN